MNIYIDGKQHLDLQFKDMKERNRKARELRKEGWTVKCSTIDFIDLARAVIYLIEAVK
jgi:hypothetical protein